MEHTPPPASPESDDSGSKKKDKKKSAKAIGEFLVEPKSTDKDTKKHLGEKVGERHFGDGQSKKTAEKSAEHTPAETMSSDEAQYAAEAFVQAKHEHAVSSDEAITDATEHNSEVSIETDSAEDEAVSAFHERVLQHQSPEEAYQQTMAEIEDGVTDQEQAHPATGEATEDAAEVVSPVELGDEVIRLHDESDRPAAEQSEEAATTTPVRATRSTASGRRSGLTASSVLGARATPLGAGQYRLNTAAAGGRPGATLRPESVPMRDESFLRPIAGGIVGYLIGRRRGRVKTEKKLLPIQKKLEKQVSNLQEDLSFKEQAIRKAVRERDEAKQQRRSPDSPPPSIEVAPKPSKRQAREHIGHMLLGAEAAQSSPKASAEAASLEPVRRAVEHQPEPTTKRNIETLSRSELMNLSDTIIIEGTSLHQIYESHLIGERGLRRLVAEHLGGGDLKKALRREIVEREIDFERDPVMRDIPAVAVSGGGASRSEALNDLLEKAGEAMRDDQDEIAFLKARAAYQEKAQEKQQQQRRAVDLTLAGTIVLLVVLVAALFIIGK